MKLIKKSLLLISTICMNFSIFAKTKEVVVEKDLYEYNNIIASLTEIQEPKVTDNYIIFTAESGPRFVGIAFEHEDYNKVHPFQIHKCTDLDGNITSSVMFYLLERPKKLSSITYRLVIDGLWTKDPLNENIIYDDKTGISLSYLPIKNRLPEITNTQEKNYVRFIYYGEEGQSIRLGGNFTNWDSWIYELKEITPGYYQLDIPLPNGTYYYNYYLGLHALVDTTNPNRAYTDEGKTVSVIVVE